MKKIVRVVFVVSCMLVIAGLSGAADTTIPEKATEKAVTEKKATAEKMATEKKVSTKKKEAQKKTAAEKKTTEKKSDEAQSGPSGKVVDTMDSSGYTYVQLEKAGKKTWVAVPQMKVTKGKTMTFKPGMEMKNFESKTLKKKFESIIFSDGVVQ